jgi:hypothetical protein
MFQLLLPGENRVIYFGWMAEENYPYISIFVDHLDITISHTILGTTLWTIYSIHFSLPDLNNPNFEIIFLSN